MDSIAYVDGQNSFKGTTKCDLYFNDLSNDGANNEDRKRKRSHFFVIIYS